MGDYEYKIQVLSDSPLSGRFVIFIDGVSYEGNIPEKDWYSVNTSLSAEEMEEERERKRKAKVIKRIYDGMPTSVHLS